MKRGELLVVTRVGFLLLTFGVCVFDTPLCYDRTTFLWTRTSLCIASACKFRMARWWDATTLLATTVRDTLLIGVRNFINEVGRGKLPAWKVVDLRTSYCCTYAPEPFSRFLFFIMNTCRKVCIYHGGTQ